MGFSMTVGVVGGKQIRHELQVLIKRNEDLRPAWKDIRETWMRLQKAVFKGKGKPGSVQYHSLNIGAGFSAWKPLKPATIKRKVADGYASSSTFPLIRTGKLRNAWTKRKHGGGAVRIENKQYFAFGIDEDEIPYAKYHQFSKPGASKLPRRRHFRTPKNVRRFVSKAIQSYLVKNNKLVRQKGFGGGA